LRSRHHPRVRDDDIRSSHFASLEVVCAKHGPEVPYRGGLDAGFAFRGRRVPFLNFQKGIYRAAAQRGPAAISVNTSYRSPYDDEETADGFAYAYRAGAIDQPDNRALRAAYELQVPLAYFVGTRPGWYRPEWPVFVTADSPGSRRVTLTPGRMVGPYDEREPLLASARSASSRKRGSSMRRISSLTPRSLASRRLVTVSVSVRFTTARTTRIWSACHPTISFRSIPGC